MTQRTPLEQELLAKAAQYLPGSSTGNTSYPDELKFLVREGKGARVWDVSGNEYIDWLMGSGPMILGHAHPAVTEAVLAAVGRGSTFFTTNEQAVLLAEELVNGRCPARSRFVSPPAGLTPVFRPCVWPGRSLARKKSSSSRVVFTAPVITR